MSNNNKKNPTKTEMVKLLTGLCSHLAEHQETFPALKGVCASMELAIQDPNKPIDNGKPAKAAHPPKPVTISYQGEEILVKGTPFATPGFEWPKYALAKIKGVLTDKVYTEGPREGEPIYKTAWDKKADAFRLSKDKEPEVVAYLTMVGCPIVKA